MTSGPPSSGCLLCDEVNNTAPLSVGLGRYANPRQAYLLETEHFALLPDLFPLTTGHSLVISKPHILNMACRDAAVEREFRDLWHASFELISREYGSPLAFEHGSVNEAMGSGACVYHAHIHLIPVEAPLDGALCEFGQTKSISALETWISISEVGLGEYLAYSGQDGLMHYVAPLKKAPPCQFVRRFVAHRTGFAGWNWKAALASSSFVRDATTLKPL